VRLGPDADDEDDDYDSDDGNSVENEDEQPVTQGDEVLELGALYGEYWALVEDTDDGIDLEGDQFRDESDLLQYMGPRPRKRGRFNPNFVGTRLNFGKYF
jgi:hypothetical protein